MANGATYSGSSVGPFRLFSASNGLLSLYSNLIFQHPVAFLTPYLFVYLGSMLLNIETVHAVRVFNFLHVGHLLLLILQLPSLIYSRNFWVFFSCFSIFILIGCYFEYPSDLWEHYSRITRWGQLGHFKEGERDSIFKMFYFWEWTVLTHSSILNRRLVLGVLSAFTQLVLLIEVERFSSKVDFKGFWKWFFLVLFASCHGYSIFGMRYYGISTTNIAYAGYLFLLGECLSFKGVNLKFVLVTFLSLMFLFFNHMPEFIFAELLLLIILIRELVIKKWEMKTVNLVALAAICGLIFVEFCAAAISGSLFEGPYGIFSSENIHRQNLVGILTVLSPLILAPFYRLIPSPLFVLGLAPALTWASPTIAKFVAGSLAHPVDILRLYWIFPVAFSWCYLAIFLERNKVSVKLRTFYRMCLCLICLLIGLTPSGPWRGKLWFQLHQAEKNRELLGSDSLANWLLENRKAIPTTSYFSDDATLYALDAHFGKVPRYERTNPYQWDYPLTQLDTFEEWLIRYRPSSIILADSNKIALTGASKVGTLLNWPSHYGDVLAQITPSIYSRLRELLSDRGWTETKVPPFYVLLEPPDLRKSMTNFKD